MAEKLALKKALFDELKSINHQIELAKKRMELEEFDTMEYVVTDNSIVYLQQHKDFIQRLIDICVDRNKF